MRRLPLPALIALVALAWTASWSILPSSAFAQTPDDDGWEEEDEDEGDDDGWGEEEEAPADEPAVEPVPAPAAPKEEPDEDDPGWLSKELLWRWPSKRNDGE